MNSSMFSRRCSRIYRSCSISEKSTNVCFWTQYGWFCTGYLHLSRPYSFKFFKGSFPQNLLSPILNTLSQMSQRKKASFPNIITTPTSAYDHFFHVNKFFCIETILRKSAAVSPDFSYQHSFKLNKCYSQRLQLQIWNNKRITTKKKKKRKENSCQNRPGLWNIFLTRRRVLNTPILTISLVIELIFSWRRSQSYRNQSIDFLCKSVDWFL